MKLLFCYFATVAALATSVSLAAEDAASVPPPVASEFLDDLPSQIKNASQLEKGLQKAYYSCDYPYGSNCQLTSHLGIFSSCNSNGHCVCDLGYELVWPSTTCQKKICTGDYECNQFGLFTHCNSFSQCECDSGYSYDLNLEHCSRNYYYSGTNFGLAIGLPVGIVSFILIVVAIILVRRRRMAEEAARLAAIQSRAVQPAVVINHQQQHPQHPQHPIYYPPQNPQQNLPPFNPTFTGYQPSQPAPPPQYFQQQPPAPGVHPSVASGSGEHYPNMYQQSHYKS